MRDGEGEGRGLYALVLNLSFRIRSSGVRVPAARTAARRLNITSVLARRRVSLDWKTFSREARGSQIVQARKRSVEQNKMLRPLEVFGGRDRGGGLVRIDVCAARKYE